MELSCVIQALYTLKTDLYIAVELSCVVHALYTLKRELKLDYIIQWILYTEKCF